MTRSAALTLALLSTLALAACSRHDAQHREPLSQAEHDSVLATESMLPGTAVVGNALSLKGRSARRAARMDAQMDSLTRTGR